ncbi:hypothetical protein [Virgisporangium aurantiacum]|nr:hypothetical protein [Virgisporangium aurantiacum]
MRDIHRRSWLGATALAALAVLLAASACARTPTAAGDTTTVASPDAAPVGADAVAIRVDSVGGYLPAIEIAARLPVITVYGDGRAIAEGPVPAIYPGPALPNVQQWRIAPTEVVALARKALAAGVGSEIDFGRPGVTDQPDTRFTVTTTQGVKQTSVYALDLVEEELLRSLSVAQSSARRELKYVLDELREPGRDSVPYAATSLAVVSVPYTGPNAPDLPAPPPVAWSGPALPGDPIGPGGQVGCVTVTGDAAKALLATAAQANAATPWAFGGKQWGLRFRPLLPDESGCADLALQR